MQFSAYDYCPPNLTIVKTEDYDKVRGPLDSYVLDISCQERIMKKMVLSLTKKKKWSEQKGTNT